MSGEASVEGSLWEIQRLNNKRKHNGDYDYRKKTISKVYNYRIGLPYSAFPRVELGFAWPGQLYVFAAWTITPQLIDFTHEFKREIRGY